MLPIPQTTTAIASAWPGHPRLKPLRDQVVVIVGASSGIGRESALRCAERGATVVAAARSEPALASLVKEIEEAGGTASYTVCDVSDFDQVIALAKVAVERYGRIDTWVNSAAVGIYASFEDLSLDEFRRVLDVNLMGSVHCAKAALPHLRQEGRGALIFISSIESTIAMPLQSPYATSKHAVQGLAETLRRDLLADRAPISVTSIKPGMVSTPFYDNALSKVGFRPTVPPPASHPAVVASTVCFAAEHAVRDIYAGGAGRFMALLQLYAPRLVDAFLGQWGVPLQRTDEPPGRSGISTPRVEDDRVEGMVAFHAFRSSPYTWLQTHPKIKALVGATAAGLIWAAMTRRSNDR